MRIPNSPGATSRSAHKEHKHIQIQRTKVLSFVHINVKYVHTGIYIWWKKKVCTRLRMCGREKYKYKFCTCNLWHWPWRSSGACIILPPHVVSMKWTCTWNVIRRGPQVQEIWSRHRCGKFDLPLWLTSKQGIWNICLFEVHGHMCEQFSESNQGLRRYEVGTNSVHVTFGLLLWPWPYSGVPAGHINEVDTYSKPVISGHSKIDKTKILMTNDSLMKFKSNAECSPWSILQYLWPALSDNWSWKPIFGLF